MWIYVDDVDKVYERAISSGITPGKPPENQFWGERTLQLHDLNGVELLFAQSIEDIEVDQIRDRHRESLRGDKEDVKD